MSATFFDERVGALGALGALGNFALGAGFFLGFLAGAGPPKFLAVAPPPHWGKCSSVQPRKFGGNLDNKELRAGTTLYLPVFNEGPCSMLATAMASKVTAKSV